ncbi:MAG: hypothetical protein LBH98_10140 [Chitinispirillales bacterium]|nr:hypothetical protein [Chitinispirillales bacterium]
MIGKFEFLIWQKVIYLKFYKGIRMFIIKEAVDNFIKHVKQNDPTWPNNHWYAGLTTQHPFDRMKQHESKKGIICEYLASISCPDEDTARTLEKALKNEGFAIHDKDLEPESEHITASWAVETVSASTSKNNKQYKVYVFKAI